MSVFDRVRSRQSRPIWLVREDPDLFEGLDEPSLRHAVSSTVVPRLRAEAGPWTDMPQDGTAIGLLVIEGLLLRTVTLGSHPRSELIGRGDVIRPWDGQGEDASVPFETSWQVLERATFAVLDEQFLEEAAHWPSVLAALVRRAVGRSRWMTLHLAIADVRRIEERMLLMFWHLADRWGHMSPEGVVVPVRLTHELLAQLVGAQRPTVTSALQRLGRAGAVRRRADRAWILDPSTAPRGRGDGDGAPEPRASG